MIFKYGMATTAPYDRHCITRCASVSFFSRCDLLPTLFSRKSAAAEGETHRKLLDPELFFRMHLTCTKTLSGALLEAFYTD